MKQIGKKIVAIMLTTAMVVQLVAGIAPVAKEVEAGNTEWDYSFELTKRQNYGTSLDEKFNVYNYAATTGEKVSYGEPSSSDMATTGYKNARNNDYLKFAQTDAAGTYVSALTYMEDMKNFTAEVKYYTYIYQVAGIMLGGEAGTFPISFDDNPYNDTGVFIYLSNDGKKLNIAGAIDRATTNYLGGTTDGTDFGNHEGFTGTAGIQGKTTFTSKVSAGNQYVGETDPYINLVITVNDGVLTVYEKDNPENIVSVALLDSYLGGTVSMFSKHDNTSFKSFGIKALPDTEEETEYAFNLTKNENYGTKLNKAFNIYNYTDKATVEAESMGEPSDSTLATMSSSHGTRNGGYLKLKKAQNGPWISTMTYLPEVTNFKAEVTYYTYTSQLAGIMFGGEKGTFPITFDSDNTNDKGVMIFVEDGGSSGHRLNIGGAIVPETTNYLGGTTAGTDYTIGGQSNFSGTANIRGKQGFTTKAMKGSNPVADDDVGITLVVIVNNGLLTVYEKDSPSNVVTVKLADSYEGGTVSLYAQHYNSSFKAFSIKKYPDPVDYDYSFDLTKRQDYGTSLDEKFNVYNYAATTGEKVSHGEPSSSDMATTGYKNARNNDYLKFAQTDAAGTYVSALTYMEDMKNFTAEVKYYTYIYQVAGIMLGGEAGTFPTSFDNNPYNDTGVFIYLSNDGKKLNIAGAIDRATTNYLGGTADGTDFGNHEGFTGTAGIQGKTTFTSKVSAGNQYVGETDPYINLIITVKDGVLTVYEKDNPENIVKVALLDSYVGGTVSLFSKNDNTSFKSFGIKALPDTEVNPNYSFNLTKNENYGTKLNKAFNIYNYTDKATLEAESIGEPSDSTLATMSSSHGTRNGGYLKLKKAQNGPWISTMAYVQEVINFKAEVTYYTYTSQLAGIMFGGEKGTFPITFDSNNTNDKGVMILLEDGGSSGHRLNIGGAIIPETTNYLGGTTAGTDYTIGGQSNFSGTANIRGKQGFTTKPLKGNNPVADDDVGITLVIIVNNGLLTVYEKDSPDKVVTVKLADSYVGGTVSLYAQHYNSSFKALSIEKYADPEIDPNLIKFDNLDLSTLEGWTSRIYNTETGESTPAEDITEQWFTGMDYPDKVPNWNTAFDHRNNPGLKPRVLTNEKTPYILTSVNDYENFESYFTYYQHSVRYGMIIGDKESYPTMVSDSAVYVYIHGSQSSGYELRVTGAVDVESRILIGTEQGKILTSSDAVRLPLDQYGFAPDAASATKTTTVHVKVEDGVLNASVDDIEATIQVNLASTYVHGGISLVSTGSAHGGFKYLRVEELEETAAPDAGETSYTMSSKDEYAVVTVNKEVAYSAFKADVNYDDTKYEYVKAIFGDANYRINGAGKKVLPVADGKVSVEAYSNTADTYVSLYFKTKDGSMATDFTGFSVDAEKMFGVGGKEIAEISSSIALEQDHKQDKKLDIVDLVCAKKDVSDEAATETREVLVGKNTVSPLFGKSALFLGDSIMNSVTDGMGWYGRLTAYGMDCDEVAQDGWALTSDAGRSRIISQFQYADENKEYDFVLLEGGVNDILIKGNEAVWGDEEENITLDTTAYEDTTIAGAMQELIVETQQRYGNAKIVYIINSEFGSDAGDKARFVTLVKKVCEVHGIDYVNLSDTDAYPELEVINDENHVNFRDYMVDNIHPNAASYALTTPIVAKRMEEVLLNSEARTCVYVDAVNGINTGNGTKDAPYQSMSYAVNKVADGGEIIIKGEYSYDETGSLGVKGKTITVSGDTLNLSATEHFNINGPVVLGSAENSLTVKVNTNGNVYANGNHFEVKENVVFENALKGIYGGSSAASVDSTHMVLKAGSYGVIYGGGPNGGVNGDTYLFVGGNVNEGTNAYLHDNMTKYMIVGGSFQGTVKGDTRVVFDGDKAETGTIYGAGNGSNSSVQGTTHVTVRNGKAYSVYGGSSTGSSKYTNVLVEGGTVAQIFGGSATANVTGSTFVEVKGGTVTRRIYGGCYNEYELFGGWASTEYHVEGTTKVILHDEATYKAEDTDNAICASSRWKNNLEAETSILEIETETLRSKLSGRFNIFQTSNKGYDKLVVAGEQIEP